MTARRVDSGTVLRIEMMRPYNSSRLTGSEAFKTQFSL